MDNMLGSVGMVKRAKKCNKCGNNFAMLMTVKEAELNDEGAPAELVFENRSSILKQQLKLELCDKCFAELYSKEEKP
jgi:hypothetical protein